MFYLSFSPLWLSVLFIDAKSILIDKSDSIITEIISAIVIILIWVLAFWELIISFRKYNNTDISTFILIEAKESKTITADFFLSYILPLFAFDFTHWDGVVEFLIFFFVLAFLCIRHNHFSVNIILELMNYRMYECELLNADNQRIERIVISKEPLSVCRGRTITVNRINNDYVKAIH